MISDADSDRSVSRDHSVLWSSNAEVERYVGSVFELTDIEKEKMGQLLTAARKERCFFWHFRVRR